MFHCMPVRDHALSLKRDGKRKADTSEEKQD